MLITTASYVITSANPSARKRLTPGKSRNPTLCPIMRAGSNGRCNTIWYKAVFKGGVYEARETVWAFRGAED